jgi:hypothetical protein
MSFYFFKASFSLTSSESASSSSSLEFSLSFNANGALLMRYTMKRAVEKVNWSNESIVRITSSWYSAMKIAYLFLTCTL